MTSGPPRRTTFMAAFWSENPHHGADFRALHAQALAGMGAADEAAVSWPLDFDFPAKATTGVAGAPAAEGLATCDAAAVIPLGANEIWQDIRNDKERKGRKRQSGVGLDMMSPRLFTLSEGLLGLGMRAPVAPPAQY